MIVTFSLTALNINRIQFTNVMSNDEELSGSYMIELTSLSIEAKTNSSIQNIVVSNYNTGLLD